MLASLLVSCLGRALNRIVSTFEWLRLVVTGGSLTQKTVKVILLFPD